MDDWKRSFVQKLATVQSKWTARFEEMLDGTVQPAFEELATFLRNHNFRVSTPLHEHGRRSFKYELAENAYVLLIFRSTAVAEFELCSECFVPGGEPILKKSLARAADVDEAWARAQFQGALDEFAGLLTGEAAEQPGELIEV